MTTTTLPIYEDLGDYNFEGAYLAQESNSARYYLDGKGVCVAAGGSLLWYDMPNEDTAFFVFEEHVLNKHLHSDFTEQEEQALSLIRDLDEQAQEYLLHVVTTVNYGEDRQYVVFYAAASQAYFMVNMDDISNVSLITSNLMAQYTEPNCLAEPYTIHVLEDGTIS